MKRSALLALIAVGLGVGCSANQEVVDSLNKEVEQLRAENEALKARASSYSPAIDAVVKQQALKPAMMGVVMPLVAVGINVSEDNWEGAQGAFQGFQGEAAKMPGVIADWSGHITPELVGALGAAVEARDKAATQHSLLEIKEACHGCHETAMVEAQQRHSWPEFSGVMTHDSVLDEDVNLAGIMWGMELSLVGTLMEAGQGNMGRARGKFKDFQARYESMTQTCSVCHTTERKYYIDRDSQARVADIAKVLASPNPTPDALMGAVMGMSEVTCDPCHRVHLPAAYTQQRPL